jgi:hypothetical protein
LLLVAVAVLAPVQAEAQSSGLSELIARQDSLGLAEPDSAALQQIMEQADAQVPPAPPWFDPFLPTVDGRVRSSVQSVILTGGIEAPIGALIPNMTGRARYERTDTDFRQRDQSSDATNFNFDASTEPFSLGEFDVSVLRRTNYEENRGRSPDPDEPPLITEYDIRELHAELVGQRPLGNGLRAIWGARLDVEDVEGAQFGVSNDRELAGGSVAGGWGTKGPWHDFVARYGYDRRSGERTLRAESGDALTERDTLWARGKIDFGQRFNIDLDARRTTFVEDRLDFVRSENGIIDTLGVANPVGDEHESTWANTWDVDLRTRPLPRLAVNAGARHSFKETSLTLSRAEIAQLANDQLNAEAIIRYAQSGSLKVKLSRNEQYNDRRSKGSTEFRGRESRLSKLAEAEFRQRVTSLIELHLDLQQTLDQNINEDPDNQNDRDRLNTRADAKLSSDPWDWLRVEVAGSYVYTEEINIDSLRVNANQNTDLYEVRGNFILDPEGGWRFIQNYRMQIKIIDRLAGIEDDRFNKQGQFDTRAEYRFASGVSVDGQYIVDYRRNGDRDPDVPDEEVYIYGGSRRDHRVNVGIRIPMPLIEVHARTERGFLRDYSRRIPAEQDRGRIDLGFRGDWSFWDGRATVNLDASHIRQFGPLVRDDTKAYWDMNASVRVSF